MRWSIVSVLLCCFGACTGFQAQLLFAQQSVRPGNPNPAGFHIIVIAGENAANVLKTHSCVQPAVELRDAENRPVVGAEVTFQSPDTGPGVVFSNGNRWQSLVSEMDGRVTVTGMQPAGIGSFQISVDAAYSGQFASATIHQTNFATLAAAEANNRISPAGPVAESTPRTGMSNRAKFAILGGVAVGIGVALAIALSHRSTSTNSTISPGTPTVGAPH